MEVWKPVDEAIYPKGKFGQTYSVSNMGRVKNNKTGRILKARPDTRKGYLRVNLATKDFKVHRLVALHFVQNPDPENFVQVNHIDGVKTNNMAENLEWCDNQYNKAHSFQIGLVTAQGEKNSQCKLTDEQVLAIWERKLTFTEIVEEYKLSEGYARNLAKKKVRTYLLE